MSYKPGDHFVQCDRCGFRKYASECRKTWDNLLVCADKCWEPKHPALMPQKLPIDKIMPKDVRPERYYFIEPLTPPTPVEEPWI